MAKVTAATEHQTYQGTDGLLAESEFGNGVPVLNAGSIHHSYYNTSISFLPGKIFRRQQSRTGEWRALRYARAILASGS